MFHFSRFRSYCKQYATLVYNVRFPHLDIFGSKVARHLTEAYRSHATSFIAFRSQGIHHLPIKIKITSISFLNFLNFHYLFFKGLTHLSFYISIKKPLQVKRLFENQNQNASCAASLSVPYIFVNTIYHSYKTVYQKLKPCQALYVN